MYYDHDTVTGYYRLPLKYMANNSGKFIAYVNPQTMDWNLGPAPSAQVAASTWSAVGNNQVSNVSGNVGIGLDAPAYKLDVSGSVRLNGAVYYNVTTATDADLIVSAAGHIYTLPAPAADRLVKLPSASTSAGRCLVFYNNTSSSSVSQWYFDQPVRAYGSPANNLYLVPSLSSIELFSDGTNWIVKYYFH